MKKEDAEVVQRICMTHRWKVLSTEQTKTEVFPNYLLVAVVDGTKFGALQASRKAGSQDWAVNASGLDYLFAAKTQNRVNVGVVLLYDENGRLVAVEYIEQVKQNLQGVEPRFGKWGQFYWVNAAFMPASWYMTNATEAESF